MSSTSTPNGFQSAWHPSGTPVRPNVYTIATGYGYNIFAGDPVHLVSATGTLQLATSDGTRSGTTDGIKVLGIFSAVRYTDASGVPTSSNFWPASTTATNIVAYVYDDTEVRYNVQYTNPSPGTTVQTAVGQECDWTVASPGGSTVTGLSSTQLSAIQATSGQFQIVGFVANQDLTDTYLQAIVRINEMQYKASVNAV